jgi:nucleotide-binding universal stress UspA family protein
MLPRFHHTLVPLDFTEKNQSALDVAFEMAVANQSRVTLLHIIEQIELPGDAEVDEFTDQLRQRSDRELELRGQRFAEANVPIDWKIRLGKRAAEIAGYETEHGIDLIVLSSHPVDADDPARSLATLSYQVAVLSRCPVLLVK